MSHIRHGQINPFVKMVHLMGLVYVSEILNAFCQGGASEGEEKSSPRGLCLCQGRLQGAVPESALAHLGSYWLSQLGSFSKMSPQLHDIGNIFG